jgi:hypothetical protein
MINKTIVLIVLVIILLVLLYIHQYHNHITETFTVQSAYNRSMRFLRYNTHPRINAFAKRIINGISMFIPGL